MPDMPPPDTESPAPKYVEFTSLDQLIELAVAERAYDFELNGKPRRIRLRPLLPEESAEIEKITERVVPPKDKDGLRNEDDPKYKADFHAAWDLRRAATLNLCILSFKLIGEDLAGKAAYLKRKLPQGVTQDLFMRVLEITSSPIQNGTFTSSAGSTDSLPG